MHNKLKKILLVVTSSDWGGAQRYVYDLAVNLNKLDNVDVSVVAGGLENGTLFKELSVQKINYFYAPFLHRNIKLFSDLRSLVYLFRLIKKNRYDIVHLNSSKIGLLGAVAAKLAGCRGIVFTAHGFVFNEKLFFLKKLAYLFITKINMLLIDRTIAVSQFDKESAVRFHILPARKIEVIHNGVKLEDCKTKEESRKELLDIASINVDKLSSKKVIGTIANFYKNKGLRYLIVAIAEVVQDYKDTVLFVIGEGPLRPEIERLILHYHLGDRVILAGYIKSPERFLRAFDIYVCSSLKEGLPYSILEASLNKIPIIATRVGGNPEIIIDKKTGILIRPQSVGDIKRAIGWMLSNTDESEHFGQQAQSYVLKNFNLNSMLSKTFMVYENVLSAKDDR